MKKKYLKLGISSLLFIFISSINVYAAEEQMAGVGYSVEPIFSKNQIDPDKGFYYIKTVPGAAEEVEAEVISTQEEPVTIKITSANAVTQQNGLMGYDADVSLIDDTLTNPITSLIKIEPETVTVANYETKIVKIKITSPEKSYPGVKAGALIFSKETEDKEAIGAKYEFRIGLLISETGDAYSDSMSLNLLAAKATIKDARKVVLATLQNPEPKILDGLTIEATIKDKKNGRVIKTKEVKDYTLAPNSRFDFDFDWGIEKIPAGDFTITMDAKNGDKSWHLTKDFSVSGKEADEINKNSPYQIITPLWVKISSGILGVFVLVTMCVLIIRRRKREVQLKNMIKKKKRKKRRQGEKR